jgi:hypothetical protein
MKKIIIPIILIICGIILTYVSYSIGINKSSDNEDYSHRRYIVTLHHAGAKEGTVDKNVIYCDDVWEIGGINTTGRMILTVDNVAMSVIWEKGHNIRLNPKFDENIARECSIINEVINSMLNQDE